MLHRQHIAFMVLLGFAAAFVLGGCCSMGMGSCSKTDTIQLVGAAQLNACGDDNKSHPVAIRFYPLKEPDKFLASSFEELWSDAAGVLGGDLVDDYREVFLAPSSEMSTPLVRQDEVTAVGMLINFCAEKDINSRRHLFVLTKDNLEKTVNLQGINFSVQ